MKVSPSSPSVGPSPITPCGAPTLVDSHCHKCLKIYHKGLPAPAVTQFLVGKCVTCSSVFRLPTGSWLQVVHSLKHTLHPQLATLSHQWYLRAWLHVTSGWKSTLIPGWRKQDNPSTLHVDLWFGSDCRCMRLRESRGGLHLCVLLLVKTDTKEYVQRKHLWRLPHAATTRR